MKETGRDEIGGLDRAQAHPESEGRDGPSSAAIR